MTLSNKDKLIKGQREMHKLPDLSSLKKEKIPKQGYRNSVIIKAYKRQKQWEVNIKDGDGFVILRMLAPREYFLTDKLISQEINKVLRFKGMAPVFDEIEYSQPPIEIGGNILFEAVVKSKKRFRGARRKEFK